MATDDVPEIGTGYCIGYRIGMDLVNLMEISNPTEKGYNPRDKLILRGLNPIKYTGLDHDWEGRWALYPTLEIDIVIS